MEVKRKRNVCKAGADPIELIDSIGMGRREPVSGCARGLMKMRDLKISLRQMRTES